LFSLWQTGKLYGYAVTFLLLPALGCLWVLLGWPAPDGGRVWWLAAAVAPWWLLAAGGVLGVSALVRYVLHRLNPQTRRQEQATGRPLPLPPLLFCHAAPIRW